jgi:hypothetical protein
MVGLGLGETFSYQSSMSNVVPVGGFNCYFPMPFEKSAFITVCYDHDQPLERLYFHVDYLALTDPLRGAGHFHAQYLQSGDWNHSMVKHEDGSFQHTLVQAEGRGHFAGFTFSLMGAEVGRWKSLYRVLKLDLDGNTELVLDDGARVAQGPEYLNPHSYTLAGRTYVMLVIILLAGPADTDVFWKARHHFIVDWNPVFEFGTILFRI